MDQWGWPASDDALVTLQHRLAAAAASSLASEPWSPVAETTPVVGACFLAYARGEAGPGRPGDRGWGAAVTWCAAPEHADRSDEVRTQAVVTGRVSSSYRPGLLAMREGPLLAAAVASLDESPDVLLVDATGLDHPRGAGLAVHLGAVTGVPTVGVTRRPLVASGDPPELRRGALAPLVLDGCRVGYWVCTRTGARALAAHAGWRTTPQAAGAIVLASSTPTAKIPVPLQLARRAGRAARALAGAG